MRSQQILASISLVLFFSLAGCKEDQKEASSPSSSQPATANDTQKSLRSEDNIIRPKPKTWSFGEESK